ncbi:MAG: zinc-ribbon domain-containing protein [Fidelibacterota bacterium]
MIAPIILFIVFVISAYFVVKPFITEAAGVQNQVPDKTPSPTELQKISLLKQIREVEFEREMGITVEEDFQRIRRELVEEVGELMDKKSASPSKGTKSSSAKQCPNCNESVSAEDKFCGHCGKSLKKSSCGTCNANLAPGAKFCSECGTKVK